MAARLWFTHPIPASMVGKHPWPAMKVFERFVDEPRTHGVVQLGKPAGKIHTRAVHAVKPCVTFHTAAHVKHVNGFAQLVISKVSRDEAGMCKCAGCPTTRGSGRVNGDVKDDVARPKWSRVTNQRSSVKRQEVLKGHILLRRVRNHVEKILRLQIGVLHHGFEDLLKCDTVVTARQLLDRLAVDGEFAFTREERRPAHRQ